MSFTFDDTWLKLKNKHFNQNDLILSAKYNYNKVKKVLY